MLKVTEDVQRIDKDGVPIDYTYTPCFGTHGNWGEVIGRCSECGLLLYDQTRPYPI